MVPPVSGKRRTVLTTGSSTSMAAGRGTLKSARKTVSSPVNVSHALGHSNRLEPPATDARDDDPGDVWPQQREHRRPCLVRHDGEHQRHTTVADETRQLAGQRRYPGRIVRAVGDDERGAAEHGEPPRPADPGETVTHRGRRAGEPRTGHRERGEGDGGILPLKGAGQAEPQPVPSRAAGSVKYE